MPNISIGIDFTHIINHRSLVDVLSPAFSIKKNNTVYFKINFSSSPLLYADYLLLIVSTVKFLKNSGVIVKFHFIDFKDDSNQINYASRVNFFKQIDYDFNENFTRHISTGRFTEIKAFNQSNDTVIFDEIISILIKKDINEDMMAVLHFCLWELLDNTLNHSNGGNDFGEGSGYVCAQYFPTNKEIRIIIADTGIGIYQALTTHPKSQYKKLTEKEAVSLCVEKGVTNSKGVGFGLWATLNMIKKNLGELVIHSGNYQLSCQNSNVSVEKVSNWKGTYTYLRINTNKPINHTEIFGSNSSINDDYQDSKGRIIDDLEDLW